MNHMPAYKFITRRSFLLIKSRVLNICVKCNECNEEVLMNSTLVQNNMGEIEHNI